MAPGTFPLPANPAYLGIPPRFPPYSLTPETHPTPMTWDYDVLQREEQRITGNMPPAPDESGCGGVL